MLSNLGVAYLTYTYDAVTIIQTWQLWRNVCVDVSISICRVADAMAKPVEFPNGLGLNAPLFVQCAWCFTASAAATEPPSGDGSDMVCELLMTLDIT